MSLDDHAAQALATYQQAVGTVPYAPDVMRACIVAEWRNHLQVIISELSEAQRDTGKAWDYGFNNGIRRAIQIIKESAS